MVRPSGPGAGAEGGPEHEERDRESRRRRLPPQVAGACAGGPAADRSEEVLPPVNGVDRGQAKRVIARARHQPPQERGQQKPIRRVGRPATTPAKMTASGASTASATTSSETENSRWAEIASTGIDATARCRRSRAYHPTPAFPARVALVVWFGWSTSCPSSWLVWSAPRQFGSARSGSVGDWGYGSPGPVARQRTPGSAFNTLG
jgi:hypothetical protein